MPEAPAPVVSRYLRTPDAALHLSLSGRTLERHRYFGTGPIYHKIGGRIVYTVADLDAWVASGRRQSTRSSCGETLPQPKPVRR
jgi:hypothetical protein